MKKILFLILLLSVSTLGIQLYNLTYKPCDKPVYYKIGIVDPEFGLTEQEVINDSEEAADILNEEYGNDIFLYSEEGELTLSFLYDERSHLNTSINRQIADIDRENATLQEKIKIHESEVAVFERKLNAFNAKVENYNSQGGAPPDVYEELTNEQRALQAEAAVLNNKANQLNLATRDYNLQVGELNENVNEFNKAITVKPEEGIYDPTTNSITIFFVNNKPEIIHTIAHEFGHALGMEHVGDKEALMYPMSSAFVDLRDADREELGRVCSEIPAYEYWRQFLFERLQKASM